MWWPSSAARRGLSPRDVPAKWRAHNIDRPIVWEFATLRSAIVVAARAISSVGQSARLTRERSLVQVQYRPPISTVYVHGLSDSDGAMSGRNAAVWPMYGDASAGQAGLERAGHGSKGVAVGARLDAGAIVDEVVADDGSVVKVRFERCPAGWQASFELRHPDVGDLAVVHRLVERHACRGEGHRPGRDRVPEGPTGRRRRTTRPPPRKCIETGSIASTHA